MSALSCPCEYFPQVHLKIHSLSLVYNLTCKIGGGSLYLSWADGGELNSIMNKLLALSPPSSWSFYFVNIVPLAADGYNCEVFTVD